jgi:hypothetical protein
MVSGDGEAVVTGDIRGMVTGDGEGEVTGDDGSGLATSRTSNFAPVGILFNVMLNS